MPRKKRRTQRGEVEMTASPEFAGTADDGEEHAFQVEVGEGARHSDAVEHEVDDGHCQV